MDPLRDLERAAFSNYPGGGIGVGCEGGVGGDLGPSQVGTADTVTMVNNGHHVDQMSLATAQQQNAMINGGHGLSPLQQIWCQQFADANRRQVLFISINFIL